MPIDRSEPEHHAPQDGIAGQSSAVDLVEQTATFVRQLRERAGPDPQPIDKVFIDALYEQDLSLKPNIAAVKRRRQIREL
jgi:hypothetical protein